MERLDFKVPRLTDCNGYEIIENDIKKQSTVKEDLELVYLLRLIQSIGK